MRTVHLCKQTKFRFSSTRTCLLALLRTLKRLHNQCSALQTSFCFCNSYLLFFLCVLEKSSVRCTTIKNRVARRDAAMNDINVGLCCQPIHIALKIGPLRGVAHKRMAKKCKNVLIVKRCVVKTHNRRFRINSVSVQSFSQCNNLVDERPQSLMIKLEKAILMICFHRKECQ